MTQVHHTIDRAAAELTHAEPRPDVRARVLASIAEHPRAAHAPWRHFAMAAAAIVAVFGAALAAPRWRHADAAQNVATRTASVNSVAAPVTATVHEQTVALTTTATTSTAAKKRRAAAPAPEYVSPTALPAVTVDAIDAPSAIQPTPLSIPQLIRQPIAPGAVYSTVLDENGSSRDR